MKKEILKLKGIHKFFSGIHALKGIDFNLYEGEVHALIGENGAGKSTLVKILCGIYKPDAGAIELFGKKDNFITISKAHAIGVSVIQQEINLLPHLTVAQNIFIGCEPLKNKLIDDIKMDELTQILFDKIGANINPREQIRDLTVGKQQMVEIAKAISKDCKLLVLDEPTAALSEPEVEELFKTIRGLQQNGVGMIYISHRMDEIKRISDRVTVMRDGEIINTVNTVDVTKEEIINMMVGRVIREEKKKYSSCDPNAPIVMEVKNITSDNKVKNISFTLRKGEILGIAGLMGAGRTEVVRALYGADSKTQGNIVLNGEKVKIKNPYQAVKLGICYLSEDRRRYGLMLDKTVTDNTAISSLDNYTKAGFINDKLVQSISNHYNTLLNTKTPSMKQIVENLSGGNQQKVIIARWLMKNADIFIFDEPTRGIDVGAKSEIYRLIHELVTQGKSIIIISSETSEILHLCDRIIVMCEGHKTGELDISEATQKEIMYLATLREEK